MLPRLLLLALAATSSPAFASTSEVRETARQLSAAHRDTVVWISVLAKTSMGVEGDAAPQIKAALAGQDKEEKSEITGTIVDSSGLIVTALSGLDKSSVVDGQTVNTPMGEIKLKATSEIKEVKVIMADGSEIPADLVLKDEDLGLAFIRVRGDSEEAKGIEFKSIDLTASAQGELLDECIVIGRLDESLNRETSLQTAEITGITTSPRRFYRVATDAVGCPVFLAGGKLLGVCVLRKPTSGAATDGQIKLNPLILPAADIAKVAAEAREAKPVEAPAAADDEADDEESDEEESAE